MSDHDVPQKLTIIHYSCFEMLTEWWFVNAIEWELGSSENSAILGNLRGW